MRGFFLPLGRDPDRGFGGRKSPVRIWPPRLTVYSAVLLVCYPPPGRRFRINEQSGELGQMTRLGSGPLENVRHKSFVSINPDELPSSRSNARVDAEDIVSHRVGHRAAHLRGQIDG